MRSILKIKPLTIFIAISFNTAVLAGDFERDVTALLKQEPHRAGNLHHCYEEPDHIYDTPAPRGYKPFYVTHYNRHGSRYLNSIQTFDKVLGVLLPLKEAGKLTLSGDSLVIDLQTIRQEHLGMEGMLTEKGGHELNSIGRRMAERYPAVFTQKDRCEILCTSSPVQRCVQSMGYFSLGIQSVYPNLDFTLLTGDRYRSYLYRKNYMKPYFQKGDEIVKKWIEENMIADETVTRLVADRGELIKLLDGESEKYFLYMIFLAGDNVDCMQEGTPSIVRYFSEKDLLTFWEANNMRAYNAVGSSIQNERYRPNWMGSALLKDFLQKADEALQGNGKCADFRFGHDAVLAPFMFFLKLEGYDMHIDMTDAADYWHGFEKMCMGSNIQMVFYRNKKCNVLVKILRNEVETSIPSVKTLHGPYYEWNVLKEYFQKLIDEEEIWESNLKSSENYIDIENLY